MDGSVTLQSAQALSMSAAPLTVVPQDCWLVERNEAQHLVWSTTKAEYRTLCSCLHPQLREAGFRAHLRALEDDQEDERGDNARERCSSQTPCCHNARRAHASARRCRERQVPASRAPSSCMTVLSVACMRLSSMAARSTESWLFDAPSAGT